MNNKKVRILVIEDEGDVRELIELHLRREGYDVEGFEDAEKAIKRMQDSDQPPFQVAVVDWMLPQMSGIEFTRCLSKQTVRPMILMVTARADALDIVKGLDHGADDYVTKPFELSVLIARVRALIRRSEMGQKLPGDQKRIGVDQLYMDIDKHEVTCSGESLTLTPSEFKLLKALLENQGKVLSRDRLIELVQGEGVTVIDRAIDTHIFGLRKKLGMCSDYIETIRGVGYRVRW